MFDLNNRAMRELEERKRETGRILEDMIYLLLHRPLHNLDLDEEGFVTFG
jgi:hypothetical protein